MYFSTENKRRILRNVDTMKMKVKGGKSEAKKQNEPRIKK